MKRNHNKRGIVPVTIISIILGLVLTPSSGKDEPAVTVPDGAQAGDLIIEPCTHKIESVEFAAECGTLVVPENRNDPDSRLIALPFKRIHQDAGRMELADACYLEALGRYHSLERPPALDLANAIRPLAILKDAAGEVEEAKRLWEEAKGLYAAANVRAGIAECSARLFRLSRSR